MVVMLPSLDAGRETLAPHSGDYGDITDFQNNGYFNSTIFFVAVKPVAVRR